MASDELVGLAGCFLSLDEKIPLGHPCDSGAGTLASCPFWWDKLRYIMLKAGGGDALMSSISLCAKLLVQISENTFCLSVQSCQEG